MLIRVKWVGKICSGRFIQICVVHIKLHKPQISPKTESLTCETLPPLLRYLDLSASKLEMSPYL